MSKFIIAAIALLSASAANAVTFTTSPGAPDSGPAVGESVVVSFDAANAAGYTWTGGTFSTRVGTLSGVAATPALETSRFGYVSSALSPNFATLSTPNLASISFYWGSIDAYNSLDVLGPGNSILLTINGNDLPPATGDQGAAATNRRIFITAGPNERITGLTFRSTGVAYEFDTIAANVPEPQSWALLVTGFGFVGFAARRRRLDVAAA